TPCSPKRARCARATTRVRHEMARCSQSSTAGRAWVTGRPYGRRATGPMSGRCGPRARRSTPSPPTRSSPLTLVSISLRRSTPLPSAARVVRVDSGGALSGALLHEGLVDELSLLIHPFLTDHPKRLWHGATVESVELRLTRGEAFDDIVWLRYR